MTEPLDLDTLLNDLSDDDEMWVLRDRVTGQYVTIPDPRYPGRRPIRFFMKQQDAESILDLVLKSNARLRNSDIQVVKVRLKEAMYTIASDKYPANADSFVVHSPNEVFEYLNSDE